MGHSSYWLFFDNSEYLGALRVRTGDLLAGRRQGEEPLCLVTDELADGYYLDYTEPIQMHGENSYELWAWGVFDD